MKKLVTLTLLGLIISVSSFAQIMGTLGACVGSTSHLYDSTATTWTWSSSNTGVATINATSGLVYGVSAGTATISFVSGGIVDVATFTVYAPPAAITGSSSVCLGSTIAVSDATVGGTWSGTGSAASVSPGGIVTGLTTGSETVYYTMGTGCAASAVISVGSSSIGYIWGDSMICTGSTGALSCSPSGGTWSSGNTAVAVVNSSTGVVTGVSSGVASISYTVSGSCGPTSTYVDVWVSGGAGSAGIVSGTSSIIAGTTTYYSSTVWGGTWSSSNTGVATVNSSGLVYGVSPGTATITYSVTSCGTVTTSTAVVTVTGVNRISGYINLSSGLMDSTTPIKVWLITYNPATHLLGAIDSMTTYSGGSSAYYAFFGEPTDSYRVKAAVFPTTFSSTGYTPTYHTSSAYWASADVFYHNAGADDNKNINMGYGTVTSGPGFIAGDVTTGANRGTTEGTPAVGMLIYAVSSTGSIVQSAYTDAAGHYTFGNLPLGTYTIYPEAINYATIAYTSINLTSDTHIMNTASFVQHLVSKTITPVTEGVNNVKSYVSTLTAFPNPSNGRVNIQWNETANEVANVTVTDITGKVIFKTSINMNEGTGTSLLDLSGLTNGVYIVSIKSATINYNNKIQVQR